MTGSFHGLRHDPLMLGTAAGMVSRKNSPAVADETSHKLHIFIVHTFRSTLLHTEDADFLAVRPPKPPSFRTSRTILFAPTAIIRLVRPSSSSFNHGLPFYRKIYVLSTSFLRPLSSVILPMRTRSSREGGYQTPPALFAKDNSPSGIC